jgi:hypothetical protein
MQYRWLEIHLPPARSLRTISSEAAKPEETDPIDTFRATARRLQFGPPLGQLDRFDAKPATAWMRSSGRRWIAPREGSLETVAYLGGTGGSNPFHSSGESATNLAFAATAHQNLPGPDGRRLRRLADRTTQSMRARQRHPRPGRSKIPSHPNWPAVSGAS